MIIVFFEVQEWEKLFLQNSFPEAIFTEEKLSEQNVETYADCEIASSFIYSKFSEEIIQKMPNLKFISTRSTGFDHVDVEYCKQFGLKVSNVPEYGSHTVAEHTFALLLTLTRKIYQSLNQTKQFDFDHRNLIGTDLYGKTIGIVGLGKIGKCMLDIAKGFGMEILVHNRSQDMTLAMQKGFDYVDLDNLLENSDVVSMHLALNDSTRHIINKENIFKMKKDSFLLNTSRGGLIETEALLTALDSGIIAGVGLDVWEEEKALEEEVDILTSDFKDPQHLQTMLMNHVLANHPKVVMTAHNAFNSKEALQRILDTTVENIKAFEEDKIINSVF